MQPLVLSFVTMLWNMHIVNPMQSLSNNIFGIYRFKKYLILLNKLIKQALTGSNVFIFKFQPQGWMCDKMICSTNKQNLKPRSLRHRWYSPNVLILLAHSHICRSWLVLSLDYTDRQIDCNPPSHRPPNLCVSPSFRPSLSCEAPRIQWVRETDAGRPSTPSAPLNWDRAARPLSTSRDSANSTLLPHSQKWKHHFICPLCYTTTCTQW